MSQDTLTCPPGRRVLLVEDDPRIARLIGRGLSEAGWDIQLATDGETGLELALQERFAVIVLDLLLPRMSGHEVCAGLRQAGSTIPILMLTALGSVEQRVAGLRMGADDYLAKPFDFEELLARIEALSRRIVAPPAAGLLRFGPLSFDEASLEVRCEGRILDLSVKDRALLKLFLLRPNSVVTRSEILKAVWGTAEDPLTNVIDVYIARLRKKLGDTGLVIDTVRGEGFRLSAAL